MGRVEKVFKKLKKEGRKALIPYIMSGDPSLDATERILLDLEDAGADLVELGVPFSDPLADGPTIQRASERSLKHGTTLKKVLNLVRKIRKKTAIPIILMTYYNPVFKMGVTEFFKRATDSGVDGVIIPDLIPDEAEDYIHTAREYGVDTIFLLAPTSTEERIKRVVRASTGFVYFVSITGVTGARLIMDKMMKETLNKVKNTSKIPVAVGFGVSTPQEARIVSGLADGVIVGSAIVRLMEQGKDVKRFVKSLREAI